MNVKRAVWSALLVLLASPVANAFLWLVDDLEPGGVPGGIDVGANNVVHMVGRANDVGMFHYSRPAEKGTWEREVLPDSDYDGSYADIAVDAVGNPHVSFQRAYPYDGIYYRHFTGTAWDARERVYDGEVKGTSLALDPVTGTPRIAIAHEIAYGHFDAVYLERDPISGTWGSTVVDTINVAHGYIYGPSLVMTEGGLPAMSFIKQDYGVGELRYATFDGSAWSIVTLDTWGHGVYSWPTSAIALDDEGYPWVAYLASNSPATRELRVAHWDGAQWLKEVVIPMSSDTFGWDLDAAFDPAGRFHIAHSQFYQQVQHAYWDGGAWQNEPIPGALGRDNCLAFDHQGNAWQAFGGRSDAGTGVAHVVPEPGASALFVFSLIGLIRRQRRRRRISTKNAIDSAEGI